MSAQVDVLAVLDRQLRDRAERANRYRKNAEKSARKSGEPQITADRMAAYTDLQLAELKAARAAVAALIAERDALRARLEQQPGVIDGAWETQPPDLYNEIASVLNKHSAENKSNTPDYVLAHFVLSSLEAFDIATNRRSAHFSGTSTTGESA